MADETLARDLEQRIEELGYELVDLEQAGDANRPILRIRIDTQDSAAESGIRVEDCTKVSRGLEAYLDERESISPRYVLEVSSPGVERPLVRPRDFTRFAGREIAVRGKSALAGRSKRLEGTLVGLDEEAEPEQVILRLSDGDEVRLPRSDISKANLIFRWGGDSRPS